MSFSITALCLMVLGHTVAFDLELESLIALNDTFEFDCLRLASHHVEELTYGPFSLVSISSFICNAARKRHVMGFLLKRHTTYSYL